MLEEKEEKNFRASNVTEQISHFLQKRIKCINSAFRNGNSPNKDKEYSSCSEHYITSCKVVWHHYFQSPHLKDMNRKRSYTLSPNALAQQSPVLSLQTKRVCTQSVRQKFFSALSRTECMTSLYLHAFYALHKIENLNLQLFSKLLWRAPL